MGIIYENKQIKQKNEELSKQFENIKKEFEQMKKDNKIIKEELKEKSKYIKDIKLTMDIFSQQLSKLQNFTKNMIAIKLHHPIIELHMDLAIFGNGYEE